MHTSQLSQILGLTAPTLTLPLSVGANSTSLTFAELFALQSTPDRYDNDLTHGNNAFVFRIGEYVVKLMRPERLHKVHKASAATVAAAMKLVTGHAGIEHFEFARIEESAAVFISRYRPNLATVSDHPRGPALLDGAGTLTQLISALTFMDIKGVLHRDLNEWGIQFDRDTDSPFILDFDAAKLVDWQGANIPWDELATGFEKDHSTLINQWLNADCFIESFLMEMCVFHHEVENHDRPSAIRLFKRAMTELKDNHCSALINHFKGVGRYDLAEAIALRKERLSYWLDDAHPARIVRLYNRKRRHFLTCALTWAGERAEDRPLELRDFRRTLSPLLAEEISRGQRDLSDTVQIVPHESLYASPAGGDVPRHTKEHVKTRDLPTRIVHIDSVAELPDVLKRPKNGIRIAYVGDAQGRLGRLAKIGTLLDAMRDRDGIDAFFALGDNVEGGSLAWQIFATTQMLSAMRVSASAVGNHEFDYHDTDYITHGLADLSAQAANALALYQSGNLSEREIINVLRSLEIQKRAIVSGHSLVAQSIEQANFPFIVSNLTFRDGSDLQTHFADGHIIPGGIAEIGGRTILFVGLVTPELSNELDYHAKRGYDHSVSVDKADVVDILRTKISAFKRKYSGPLTVVVLSHCGLPIDKKLAFDGVDIILGSHTHNIVHRMVERFSGNTHIVHGGQNALMLGILDFDIGPDGAARDVEHTLVDIEASEIEPASPYREILDAYSLPSATVGYSPAALRIEGKSVRSTPLMNFVTDAIRAMSETDISMSFGGAVRDGFRSGDVSENDLAEAIPFDNTIRLCTLSGRQLKSIIQNSIERSRRGAKGRSLLLHFSGLRYKIGPAGNIEQIEVKKGDVYRTMEEWRLYSFAYPDFMENGLGDDFPLAKIAKTRGARNSAFTLRQAVRESLRRGDCANGEDRIFIHPDAPLVLNKPEMIY